MKNKSRSEMWRNALSQIDEKYIAEAAELVPESENTAVQTRPEKGGTGNLGFTLAAAAAVIVSFIGVGFFFKGTGIEPLSPASEGTVGASNTEENIDADETSKQPLTMEKLKAIVSAKGEELDWADFRHFEGIVTGSGLYIMVYEIDDEYCVMIGGTYPDDPDEKAWYVRLVRNFGDDNEAFIDLRSDDLNEFLENPDYEYEFEAFEEAYPFELLGDYYEGQDGLFHVSGESWTVCEDYDLFREYFFGVWGEDFVIDDSEKDWLASNYMSVHFTEFYRVSENILAFSYGGSGGSVLHWLDIKNPDVLYGAYGSIGDFPDGFPKNEDGEPASFTMRKTSSETNEPQYGYLSIYRLRELSKEYGIEPSLITDFEMQTENGKQYHDSKYYFYPMYLVGKTDNWFVIATQIENTESIYFSGSCTFVTVSFWNNNGQWERKIYPDICPADCTLHIIYDEENPEKIKDYEYNNDISVSVIVPEGVTSIADGVFEDCKQLESVILPSTLKIIGVDAFKDCTNLKEINIPYGVTTISERAFENCTALSPDLILPDTVTTIGDGAFAGCTQFDGTMKPAIDEYTVKCPVGETDDFALIRPVDSTFITTDYSEGEGGHDGIDYAGETGDNIYAAADGIVTAIETDYKVGEGYGKYVIIDHGNGFTTSYLHLDSISVEMFAEVSQGDIIGGMGSTGWATGPHLHFVLAENGAPVDPHIYLDDPIQLIHPTGDVYPEDDILFGYGEYEGHEGIDYTGEKGQYVSAAANGTVSFAGRNENNGNYVIIDHRDGYQTVYCHLDEINVAVGDTVTTGHLIGRMGSTGFVTGIQLHFELLKDGENLNPADYIAE